MLLRFRVANHRSIRDEQTLSLVATPLRGEPKPRSTEIPRTIRVAGIYGANASGKSNVLAALWWFIGAIRASHTVWPPGSAIPRQPFALSDQRSTTPSFFELDFLHNGVRHSYGFEVDNTKVIGEWLFAFPHGKARKLFERTGPEEFAFGRALQGQTHQIARLTRENSLYLSSAAMNNHGTLGPLYLSLTTAVGFAMHGEGDEGRRLSETQRMLRSAPDHPAITRLLRLADLGVEGAEIVEKPVLTETGELLSLVVGKMEESFPGYASLLRATRDDTLDDLRYEIRLRRSTGTVLALREESAGTRVWLSVIGPVTTALEQGRCLVVDEIDSSLHPLLSSTLIRLFKDPGINRRGAQLIFASHDTTLLGTMLNDGLLGRDEVWFTEKDESGATSLYSLAEFHPRKDENIERGYLQGRYGAVPYVSFEKIRDLFISERPNDSE
ncbi:AAA family ATPase [Microbispora sp. H10670]|uniref:AAA family ATPase n=1 Tax=Microbispora sp. H10670 TaxID=2729108 RepID=UPI001601AE5A|nr:ATP-binding protein [Microbispora sp. H10670]